LSDFFLYFGFGFGQLLFQLILVHRELFEVVKYRFDSFLKRALSYFFLS
jgi:hypothetical protein